MPRIRTIKPEYWTDEKMSLLDPLTRLVFLGLMSMADDEGRLVDNVKLLDGMLFPNTDDSSRESLEILARVSRITRYVTSSGQNVIQIVNWSRHQRVDHPNKYCLPGPSEAIAMQPRVPAPVTPPLAKSSRKPREDLARPSRNPRDTTSTSTSTNDLSSAPDGAGNWVAEATDLLAAVGAFSHGRVGKALGPDVKRYGWPDTRKGLVDFVKAPPPKYGRKTPETFAEQSGTWIVGAQQDFVDKDGVPTARADRLFGIAS
jgi:hypothetical protein